MKKIEFIIQPEGLVSVSNVLSRLGIVDAIISQVRKFTQHNDQVQHYRELELTINFLTKGIVT